MTKYLLGSLILLLASVVQADLCDSPLWEAEPREQTETSPPAWQQVKDIIESEGFDADAMCNEMQDRALHVALKIPEPMSIESYYAIATFVETVPFLTDIPFLYSRNRPGQTPYTLARRRFENMLERIDRDINRDDLSQMASIAEREVPEYRLYSSIMMGFPGGERLVEESRHDLESISPTFLLLMINEINRGLTFENQTSSMIEDALDIFLWRVKIDEALRSLPESERVFFEEWGDFFQESILSSNNTSCLEQLTASPDFLYLVEQAYPDISIPIEDLEDLFTLIKEKWNACINQ